MPGAQTGAHPLLAGGAGLHGRAQRLSTPAPQDVHHGNGTQQAFYSDPECSTSPCTATTSSNFFPGSATSGVAGPRLWAQPMSRGPGREVRAAVSPDPSRVPPRAHVWSDVPTNVLGTLVLA